MELNFIQKCDVCAHKGVCQYREEIIKKSKSEEIKNLENLLGDLPIDVDLKCKHFMVMPITTRGMETVPWAPLQDGGRKNW